VSIPEDKDRGTTGNSMVLTRLADLFSEPDEVISWQWEGILPVGGFSVVASKPKTGKSTIARNLALCTARGETFFEQGVNQGAVIYYALEEKKAEVKRHFRDMGAQGDEPIYIYAGGASLDALREVYEAVKTIKPVLIIIDPLFRLAKVKDGNDYIQVTEALDPLLRLARETGSHVLCVHHTGKGERAGGDSVLGSTAIFSSVDTLLIMKRHERYRTIQSIQRYGTDLEETTLHFDMDSRTLSIGKSREEEDIGSMKDAIGDFLSNREEPATEPEIMADVEGRTGLKRKALRELVKDGTVDRQGKGGKGDPFKYSCSLVPIYIREQENENPKNDVTPCNNEENACSQVLGDSGGNDESRERAFSGSEGLEDGDPGEVIELAEEDVEIIE
jgi:predicted ATP-dependent serine protease